MYQKHSLKTEALKICFWTRSTITKTWVILKKI